MTIKIIALIVLSVTVGMDLSAQNGKTLIAYLSWSGSTQHVPEYIDGQTEGTLFRIETVIPYPTGYKPCTEAAKQEKEQNTSTYRDETLAKIVEPAPGSKHLKGFGAVNLNTEGITECLKEIKVIR